MEKYSHAFASTGILTRFCSNSRYNEIIQKFNVVYVAGGAAQNTARGAQYLLPPNSTVYIGCVSNDKFADAMKEAAAADGLRTHYMVTDEAATGTCGVLITGHNR